ncbi:SIMPL domain-containing protein [Altericista sp. CCNU0014]|uniref:SIMPL domain-containing protein n=1 Tax=Altericista sp. CCNU0014 TaxID=3082949 RepID=UPI00384CF39E
MKWKRYTIAAIALCTLGATGLGPLTLSALAQPRLPQPPQERMLRTLTVTGQSTEKIASTIAQVQLGVEAQGKTAQQVQQEVAKRSSAVVALLKSRNVEQLQTTGINLNPQYSYNDGKQTLTGYQASNTVSFRVPIPQAGSIVDDAVKAGASRIDSLSFTASDRAIADAQKIALRKATQDAQEQAQAVFGTLGLTFKDVVSIQINNANTPPPRPYPVAFSTSTKMAGEAVSTPVEGGEQSVQASVTLQMSY